MTMLGGHLDEALNYFKDMFEKGLPPSVVAFNSISAAYSREGLEEMHMKDIKLWISLV